MAASRFPARSPSAAPAPSTPRCSTGLRWRPAGRRSAPRSSRRTIRPPSSIRAGAPPSAPTSTFSSPPPGRAAMTSDRGYAGRRGPRYSALRIAWHGVTRRPWEPVFTERPLRSGYDVVIVGGGVHGLATAYHLARYHQVRDVVVLERGYVGGGNSGRNTAIVRANYLTPAGIAFYERSLRLYEQMTDELNFNVMFEPRGQLTLAHTDSALRTLRWRAEANQVAGVGSAMLDPR